MLPMGCCLGAALHVLHAGGHGLQSCRAAGLQAGRHAQPRRSRANACMGLPKWAWPDACTPAHTHRCARCPRSRPRHTIEGGEGGGRRAARQRVRGRERRAPRAGAGLLRCRADLACSARGGKWKQMECGALCAHTARTRFRTHPLLMLQLHTFTRVRSITSSTSTSIQRCALVLVRGRAPALPLHRRARRLGRSTCTHACQPAQPPMSVLASC